jgi:hypothetical protein
MAVDNIMHIRSNCIRRSLQGGVGRSPQQASTVCRLYDRGVLRLHRYAWASPASAVGLALASLGLWRGRISLVEGIVEAQGPALAWVLTHLVPLRGGAAAMTFGHVVIARDAGCLESSRAHERVHVRQYERWGPLFIPAYLAGSLWAILRRRHPYFGNPFEIEAFR